ncbi:MAG: aryl-sulfate sulfotransferase [Ignavibacteria bacterium]|nr:aryl-sulfate sulfotransferase [Ignavibacteria bacterium]
MKNKKIFILFVFLFLPLFILSKELPVQYLSPLPDSKYNNTGTNIIISSDKIFNLSKPVIKGSVIVKGSISGVHDGDVVLSADKRTIMFKPIIPFEYSETVSVILGIPVTGGSKPFEYVFYIKDKKEIKSEKNSFVQELMRKYNYTPIPVPFIRNTDSLPPDFPQLTVTVSNSPTPGKIFLTDFSFFPTVGTYLMIFNNDGSPFFYRKMPGACTDFKQISNGNLVYCDGLYLKYYELDTSYIIVDSFYTGNGYTTDLHELEYLNNGHAYLMSYDTVFVNMNLLIPGADTNAMVIGLIIQEIDANKNVVFQWRSWDHIPITECANQDLYNDTIDYVHGNAIELDTDGNILISSRHLNEITKINRTSGNIMWRLGGVKNQFTFINDSIKFNFQHDIRRLKNGNITLFDNGNQHTPPFSRAVEYELNEQAKTAKLVWQFRNSPNSFGAFMGNVQRLENGNSIIGWGGTFGPLPTVMEVTPNGTKIFEMNFPLMVFSYRAYRFDWDYPEIKPVAPPTSYALLQNYPNPFNPYTTIEFDIPETQFIRLVIYDILGREIAVLVNGQLQPQKYKIQWNAANASSGVYFYKLTGSNFSDVKKMVLIR